MTDLDCPSPICIGCGKTPDELEEYQAYGQIHGLTPVEFVILEEGSYNPYNGHFACTDCYIRFGMPSSPYGWVAP